MSYKNVKAHLKEGCMEDMFAKGLHCQQKCPVKEATTCCIQIIFYMRMVIALRKDHRILKSSMLGLHIPGSFHFLS